MNRGATELGRLRPEDSTTPASHTLPAVRARPPAGREPQGDDLELIPPELLQQATNAQLREAGFTDAEIRRIRGR